MIDYSELFSIILVYSDGSRASELFCVVRAIEKTEESTFEALHRLATPMIEVQLNVRRILKHK
jgi:hypothetical protein